MIEFDLEPPDDDDDFLDDCDFLDSLSESSAAFEARLIDLE